MNRRSFIGALMALPLPTIAAVPLPFDYARGSLEHGVVLDDQGPGAYYYAHNVSNEPTVGEWIIIRADDSGVAWYKMEKDTGEAQD